jgi:predicted amidophosphoribosyltransferase
MKTRLIKIDESTRKHHSNLDENDICYFFGEYLPRLGYNAGPVNSLVLNYKKPVNKRGTSEYKYKEQAIETVAEMIACLFMRKLKDGRSVKDSFTIVPIPPSKEKIDPLYDDRLIRTLNFVKDSAGGLDVRDMLYMTQTMRPHHEYKKTEKRPTHDELYPILGIDSDLLKAPLNQFVILFDDILTTGAHFKACQRVLREHMPDARPIVGLFIARRVTRD